MAYRTEESLRRILTTGWAVPENEKIATQHDRERSALRTANTTRGLFIHTLKKLDNHVKKPFKEMSKEDTLAFMGEVASKKSNAQGKCLKVFFQWLYDLPKGKYPPCIEWLRFNGQGNGKLPEEMLTKADILKLVQSARDLRDKALIFMLYDTGARAGEITSIRLKHVKFDDPRRATTKEGRVVEWIPVFLRGKTGERVVYIQDSIPVVREWVSEHPTPSNPEAPLFPSRKKIGQPIEGANTLGQIIDRAVIQAGLRKRIYPHLFRHSRATHLSQTMTEQELKLWFGWSGGSRMPATYTHLNAGNILDKLKRINGVEIDKAEADPLAPQTCLICKTSNPAGGKFCKQCEHPLDPELAIAEREKRRRRERLLDKIIERAEKEEDYKILKNIGLG